MIDVLSRLGKKNWNRRCPDRAG